MPYRIAGIDVHEKMLAVVVADVEVEGDFQFDRQKIATSPADLRPLAEWLVDREVEEVVMESTRAVLASGLEGAGAALAAEARDGEPPIGRPASRAARRPDDGRRTDRGGRLAVRLVGDHHVAIGTDFDGGVPSPHGIEDIADYAKITEGLVRKGYSAERIRKIMGQNLLRLIRTVTEKRSR